MSEEDQLLVRITGVLIGVIALGDLLIAVYRLGWIIF